MSRKRKPNVCLSILLGIGTLHGTQYALGDIIDEECLEEFDSNSRLSIERLSPLALDCFRTKSSTYIQLARANIGFVDAKAVETGDLESLRELLLELRELTDAFEQLDLKLVEIRPDTDGQRLIYRQQINGIAVDNRNWVIFGADGHVSTLNSSIVDPKHVVPAPSVSEAEAVTFAIEAIEHEVGGRLENATVSDNPGFKTKLYYSHSARNDIHELYWRASVSGQSMGFSHSYSAIVNATTGETAIANNLQR